MELRYKIRSLTYTTSSHATMLKVELHTGFSFSVESLYVNEIDNTFGERYAFDRAMEMLQCFDDYARAEDRYMAKQEKEEA